MRYLPVFIGILLCSFAQASTNFAAVFSDQMVLQRNKPIHIWGNTESNGPITLRFANHTTRAEIKNGKWQASLPSTPAGGPYELILEAPDGSKTLKNILVGDVWLAGGQSNMQWQVNRLADAGATARALATNPQIRLLQIARNPDLSGELGKKEQTGWATANAQSINNFSAVAFYFASFLQKETGIPIGIIDCSWGGTGAEAWMSPQALQSRPQFQILQKLYQEELTKFPERYRQYKEAIAAHNKDSSNPRPVMPMGPYHHRRPSGLYETMLSGIAPYTLKGFIFYQGESNRFTPEIYEDLFTALIADWRNQWNDADLPFLFVQLAGYAKADFRTIRDAQQKVWEQVAGAAMVTAIDVGDPEDIHPLDKETVGRRLANLALREAYNRNDVVAYGPLVKSITPDNGAYRITFSHTDGGLKTAGDMLLGFEIAGANKRFYPAEAIILTDDTVRVHSPAVPTPVAVRYAWQAFSNGNLYNEASLPAFPFKSDNWENDPDIDISNLEIPTPDTPDGSPLAFTPNTHESRSIPVLAGKTRAWQSQPMAPGRKPDILRYLHFKASQDEEALNSADAVLIRIQYLDMGNTTLRIQYDSKDGPWHQHPTDLKIGNTLEWKTAEILLQRTQFHKRQHGHDLRLRTTDGKNVVILGIWASPSISN